MTKRYSRRDVATALGTGAVVGLAGCSAIGGDGDGGGGGCGPGDRDIGSLDAGTDGTVTITGEVLGQPGTASFSIDDGTGFAYVVGAGTTVEAGDCVTVTGTPEGMVQDTETIEVSADEISTA